jgi:hypothetical protein
VTYCRFKNRHRFSPHRFFDLFLKLQGLSIFLNNSFYYFNGVDFVELEFLRLRLYCWSAKDLDRVFKFLKFFIPSFRDFILVYLNTKLRFEAVGHRVSEFNTVGYLAVNLPSLKFEFPFTF